MPSTESSYVELALCKNTQQKYGPDLKQNANKQKIKIRICSRGIYIVESTRMQCGNSSLDALTVFLWLMERAANKLDLWKFTKTCSNVMCNCV